MKRALTVFITVMVFAIAVVLAYYPAYLRRDKVEQSVFKDYDGSIHYVTVVWVNSEIVKIWDNDLSKVTDSLKQAQKEEGERILKLVK